MLSKTGYTSKTKLVAMVMSKRLIVISGIPEIIEGAVFIRWNIWEPKEEDGFTMVGVQKGNTLTYTELGDTLLPLEQKIMDEKTYQEMIEPYEHRGAVKYAYLVMTVLCCVMGVKSLRKKEKKNQ